MARPDFFLVSKEITGWTEACYIKPGYKTDHSLIGINISPYEQERGRGFWKLNSRILEDLEYVSQMNQNLDKVMDSTANLQLDQI